MVDFERLRKQRSLAKPIDPIELFRRLPRASEINDLWNSQAEALKEWSKRRDEKDLVIKLNTGGGKTLVGLLIAQSIINEKHGSVLYLSPNNQIVDQIISKAKEYGIPAVKFSSGQDLDEKFLSGQAVLISTYAALFNGMSRFGVAGGSRDIIKLDGIILDDAHTAFSEIRDRFTVSVENLGETKDLYSELTQTFRGDFADIGRQGTFDDIVADRDKGVLEVPYWSWLLKFQEIRRILSEIAPKNFPFVWPLVRDSFNISHSLISSNSFSITPLLPMIDMFPTFADCPRRIYMSATVADDSSIIRTFGASLESVSKPIAPSSLAGVGERMILAPALMQIPKKDLETICKTLAKSISKEFGVVVLTPSKISAEKWNDSAQISVGDEVSNSVAALVKRKNNGPFVFPNRYDGIDLVGDSCRLLIIDGLPTGSNLYDIYRATVFEGSAAINATFAQRVEQGMGRGTRGAGDHCIVLLMGKNLISWISLSSNLKLMTSSTRSQLELGINISHDIGNEKELKDTIAKCLYRDTSWVTYHAEVVADSAISIEPQLMNLKSAEIERHFFKLTKDGHYDKAIDMVEKFISDNPGLESRVKGWLLQLAARIAFLWGNVPKSETLQQQAFSFNSALLRPKTAPPYVRLFSPSKQSQNIINMLETYELKKGYPAHFEEVVDLLVPESTSNQFEESINSLGLILGFSSQRPDHLFGKGPDVLWITNEKIAFIIEIKSRKKSTNPLTKAEHGQLLESFVWFQKEYPEYKGYKIIIHPNVVTSDSVTAADTYALTINQLNYLIMNMRKLVADLSATSLPKATLVEKCEKLLEELHLTPELIITKYLSIFKAEK